jgi:hypothetical protein
MRGSVREKDNTGLCSCFCISFLHYTSLALIPAQLRLAALTTPDCDANIYIGIKIWRRVFPFQSALEHAKDLELGEKKKHTMFLWNMLPAAWAVVKKNMGCQTWNPARETELGLHERYVRDGDVVCLRDSVYCYCKTHGVLPRHSARARMQKSLPNHLAQNVGNLKLISAWIRRN